MILLEYKYNHVIICVKGLEQPSLLGNEGMEKRKSKENNFSLYIRIKDLISFKKRSS